MIQNPILSYTIIHSLQTTSFVKEKNDNIFNLCYCFYHIDIFQISSLSYYDNINFARGKPIIFSFVEYIIYNNHL